MVCRVFLPFKKCFFNVRCLLRSHKCIHNQNFWTDYPSSYKPLTVHLYSDCHYVLNFLDSLEADLLKPQIQQIIHNPCLFEDVFLVITDSAYYMWCYFLLSKTNPLRVLDIQWFINNFPDINKNKSPNLELCLSEQSSI